MVKCCTVSLKHAKLHWAREVTGGGIGAVALIQGLMGLDAGKH